MFDADQLSKLLMTPFVFNPVSFLVQGFASDGASAAVRQMLGRTVRHRLADKVNGKRHKLRRRRRIAAAMLDRDLQAAGLIAYAHDEIMIDVRVAERYRQFNTPPVRP